MSDDKKACRASSDRSMRPYWRDLRSIWIWIALAVVIASKWFFSSTGHAGPESLAEGIYEVRRVIDGDTLELMTGAIVHVDGIDPPETVKEDAPATPWSSEASELTKEFVERAGGRVGLTFPLERRDRRDRFLAFVWNGDEMLNEELIRAGLARAKVGYNYNSAMKRRLSDAQKEAQREGRGIWSRDESIVDTARP